MPSYLPFHFLPNAIYGVRRRMQAPIQDKATYKWEPLADSELETMFDALNLVRLLWCAHGTIEGLQTELLSDCSTEQLAVRPHAVVDSTRKIPKPRTITARIYMQSSRLIQLYHRS
jgi:hypothetical protein